MVALPGSPLAVNAGGEIEHIAPAFAQTIQLKFNSGTLKTCQLETLSRILNCDIVLPEPNTIPRSKRLAFVLWI